VEPEDHAAADVGPGVFDGRTETCKVNQWSVLSVVGVGKVDSCGLHLVELLPRPGNRVGQVDEVEGLGAAEAGDLDSAHGREATACSRPCGPAVSGCVSRGPPHIAEARALLVRAELARIGPASRPDPSVTCQAIAPEGASCRGIEGSPAPVHAHMVQW
jgi:hypothetical protein